MTEQLSWLTLALLGAYHGLNPGMGWLFAVALGLQEGSRSAVLRALGPIALGHAASVAAILAFVALAQVAIDPDVLRLACGAGLLAFGLYKLARPLSHPRWVGLRVGGRDLVHWSFLMATAHGAGLMLVPLVLRLPADGQAAHGAHGAHAEHLAMASAANGMTLAQVGALGVHSVAMFAVMAVVAVVVFDRVGLRILRRAWLNLDRLWAGALIGAGVLTVLL